MYLQKKFETLRGKCRAVYMCLNFKNFRTFDVLNYDIKTFDIRNVTNTIQMA